MKYTRAIVVLVSATLGVGSAPPLTTTAAVAADPCGLPRGVLKLADLASRSAIECGAVGRLVDAGNGVPLPVQQPGRSVTLDMLYPDGARTFTLATDARGVVTTGSHHQASKFPDLPGPGACERDTYSLRSYKWYKPWLFRTTRGTALANQSQAAFDAAARRATANMTQGRNTCGLRGGIHAAGAFVGHTNERGNFVYADGQTTCGDSDGRNVIDAGDLPGGFLEATLAWTCTWAETRHGVTMAVSADIRMNDTDYKWTYDPVNDPACQPALPPDQDRWRYDVESVLTHEIGHVYGLVNLSAAEDVNLTMYPGVRRCTGHMRTLGRGDVLGLRALYGSR
ncbi:matrixin family metalloprotease [Kribbella sp. NPDC004138]